MVSHRNDNKSSGMSASILTTHEWKKAREVTIHQFMPAGLRPSRNIAVGKRLRLARLAFGVDSQGKFAEAAGLRANAYNMWETGENYPGLDNAIKLCDRHAGLSLDWIFRGKLEGMPNWLSNAIAGLMRAEIERAQSPLPAEKPRALPKETVVQDRRRRQG